MRDQSNRHNESTSKGLRLLQRLISGSRVIDPIFSATWPLAQSVGMLCILRVQRQRATEKDRLGLLAFFFRSRTRFRVGNF